MKPDAESVSALRLAVLGVWTGVLLTAARAFVLYGMDHLVRGHTAQTTWLRITSRLAETTFFALACGLVAVFAAARWRRLGLGWLVAAGAVLVALSGWPWSDPYHVPDPASGRGLASLGALAGCAALGAGVLSFGVHRMPRAASGRGGFLLAGAILLIAPVAARYLSSAGGEMVLREVVRDLTDEVRKLRVVRARLDAPPRADILTPTRDYRVDAGDLPALILPPPCAVEFRVWDEEGPVTFVAAAGVDESVFDARLPREAELAIRFKVTVNGSDVFDETVKCTARAPVEIRAWRRLGGGDGIDLAPGDVVRLATEVVGPAATEDAVFTAGFGGCVLERRTTRARTRSTPETPNIVLIVMDTLRADRTSLFGYAKPTTPRLEELAARGTTYLAAHSTSSWTWPSTASILTGLSSEAHGVQSSRACHLASELETLAEALQKRGYTTAAFIGNPLIVADKNFDQGFEFFTATRKNFLFSEMLMPDLRSWIERHAGTRFFVYAHLVETHVPYRPLPEYVERFTSGQPEDYPDHGMTKYADELLAAKVPLDPADVVPPEHARWISELYDASVATADYWTGEVLALLDELDLTGETIVAFTSDHGEELFDHGRLKHGQALHGELVHVPLILAGPGIPAGVRHPTPVSNRHLAPTLAGFGGAELAAVDDAIDLGRPDSPEARPIFYSTYSGWIGGVRDRAILGVLADDWVLHLERRDDAAVPLGLYHRRDDPGERKDLAAEAPDRTEALSRVLLERAEALERAAPRARAGGARTIEMLQGIGYMGDDDDDDESDG